MWQTTSWIIEGYRWNRRAQRGQREADGVIGGKREKVSQTYPTVFISLTIWFTRWLSGYLPLARHPFNEPFFFWLAPFPSSLQSTRLRGDTSYGPSPPKKDGPVKWNGLSNRQASCWEYQRVKKKMHCRLQTVSALKLLCVCWVCKRHPDASLQPWCPKDPGWPPKAFLPSQPMFVLKRANKIAFILRDVWKSSVLFCGRTNHSQARAYISFLCLVKSGGTRPAALMQIRAHLQTMTSSSGSLLGFLKHGVGWMLKTWAAIFSVIYRECRVYTQFGFSTITDAGGRKPFFSLSDPQSSHFWFCPVSKNASLASQDAKLPRKSIDSSATGRTPRSLSTADRTQRCLLSHSAAFQPQHSSDSSADI